MAPRTSAMSLSMGAFDGAFAVIKANTQLRPRVSNPDELRSHYGPDPDLHSNTASSHARTDLARKQLFYDRPLNERGCGQCGAG